MLSLRLWLCRLRRHEIVFMCSKFNPLSIRVNAFHWMEETKLSIFGNVEGKAVCLTCLRREIEASKPGQAAVMNHPLEQFALAAEATRNPMQDFGKKREI